MPCDARVAKGQELGWFEHGSTIIVFVPPGFEPAPGIETGQPVRQGQALLRRQPPVRDLHTAVRSPPQDH